MSTNQSSLVDQACSISQVDQACPITQAHQQNAASPAGKSIQSKPVIYQNNPFYNKPSLFPAKGWTGTIEGYMYEARRWTYALSQNLRLMARPYCWVVHLNLKDYVLPVDIGPMWSKVTGDLKAQGIVALWVREPNRANKVHYHILVKNSITKKRLKKAIRMAMSLQSIVRWRQRVEPIQSQKAVINYIFKAKVPGLNKKGEWVDDIYASKRLLFQPKLPFDKVGVIGGFWENKMSVSKFWNKIKEQKKQMEAGLNEPDIQRLCQHVYDFFGGNIHRGKIERSFGMNPNCPVVQDWIEKLRQGGWTDEYWRQEFGKSMPLIG